MTDARPACLTLFPLERAPSMYLARTRTYFPLAKPMTKPLTKAGLLLALLTALSCGVVPSAHALGSWMPLASQAPEPIGTTLLLTDGTVLAQGTYGVQNDGKSNDGISAHWFKLTPDAQGSYANGTWTRLADMHHQRLYYASAVLRDGRVFVAGGEYTEAGYVDTNTAEVYDPITDLWTEINGPSGWNIIGDAPLKTLFDGTLLLGGINASHTGLYDYTTNTWRVGGDKPYGSDEESWALLPDQTVLTSVINNSPNAQKYIPSSNIWVSAGQSPVDVAQTSSREIGPGVLLADGRCLFVGATGHTALYTMPSDPALPGTWQAGPDFPADGSGTAGALLEAKDAPGCLMVNGKVLCLVAPHGDSGTYPNGQKFFEYTPDPGGGAGTLAAAPDAGLDSALTPAFTGRMLALPSGQVLYSNFNTQLAVYTPDGSPDPSWSPAVTGLAAHTDGSFQVSGTQFNGLSEGAYYGDDASESTNYPLVRLTDGAGVVSYARTFNHSTMGLATGSLPVSTNFTTPMGLVAGTYQLQVVANGIASAPVSFTTPMAADVSGQVLVLRGDFRYRRATNTFAQLVTLTNTGTASLAGPLALALDQLSLNARLANASGTTVATLPAGSPFVTVSPNSLAPGASVSVLLSFSDLNFRRITYATRILSGNGN